MSTSGPISAGQTSSGRSRRPDPDALSAEIGHAAQSIGCAASTGPPLFGWLSVAPRPGDGRSCHHSAGGQGATMQPTHGRHESAQIESRRENTRRDAGSGPCATGRWPRTKPTLEGGTCPLSPSNAPPRARRGDAGSGAGDLGGWQLGHERHGLSPRMDVQLLVDAANVRIHGVVPDSHRLGDFLVEVPLSEQRHHLVLAF